MKVLTVEAKIDNVETVTNFINEVLEENDASIKAQTQIDVVIDELFSNIAFYAYPDGVGLATVTIDIVDENAVITFIDSGMPYNPLENKDPDITLSAQERTEGGLGIFMVKKMMDNIYYKHEDNKNMLTIEKKIGF